MTKEKLLSLVLVDELTGCWLWQRAIDRGYGCSYHDGRNEKAHRIAYKLWIGPIPDGCVLDHLCRQKSCCNPKHLEAVPQKVNVMRGVSDIASRARQTHCIHGHELSGDNLRVEKGRYGSVRVCKACKRRRVSFYHHRDKAA